MLVSTLTLLALAQPAPPPPPPREAPAESEADAAAPRSASELAELGAQRLREGRVADALPPLQQALELDGSASAARYNLAYAYRKLGRNQEAAEAYRLYVQQVPDDADAWFALAETEQALNRPDAAAQAYLRYADVESRPDQAKWVELARTRARELGAVAGPRAPNGSPPSDVRPPDAEVATRSAPPLTTGAASLEPALRALRTNDFDAALRALRRDVPDPSEGFSLAAYGSAHLGRGDFERAAAYFRDAAGRLRGEARAGAFLGRAEALWALGQSKEAQALYREVQSEGDSEGPWVTIAARRLSER